VLPDLVSLTKTHQTHRNVRVSCSDAEIQRQASFWTVSLEGECAQKTGNKRKKEKQDKNDDTLEKKKKTTPKFKARSLLLALSLRETNGFSL